MDLYSPLRLLVLREIKFEKFEIQRRERERGIGSTKGKLYREGKKYANYNK